MEPPRVTLRASLPTSTTLLGNTWGVYNVYKEYDDIMYKVDARLNWWGDPRGPTPEGSMGRPKGDRVPRGVFFAPWLRQPV